MPAYLSISITGVDRLVAKFGRVQSLNYLKPPMYRAVYRLQRQMATYPPKPPRSTYRRTGTYGRRWTVRVDMGSDGLTGKVGIRLWYAPVVGSAQFQTQTHRRTGWTTDRQAVQRERSAIVKDFNAEIRRALR